MRRDKIDEHNVHAEFWEMFQHLTTDKHSNQICFSFASGKRTGRSSCPSSQSLFEIKKAEVVVSTLKQLLFKSAVTVFIKLKCTRHLKIKVQWLAMPSTFVLQIGPCYWALDVRNKARMTFQALFQHCCDVWACRLWEQQTLRS
jgi:hypothetical protein